MNHYIGIDVGTTSVRAALVGNVVGNASFNILETSVVPVNIWNERPDHFEQSGEDIWNAIVTTVQSIVRASGLKPCDINGLGFDATCSLVVLDKELKSVSVTPKEGSGGQDHSR